MARLTRTVGGTTTTEVHYHLLDTETPAEKYMELARGHIFKCSALVFLKLEAEMPLFFNDFVHDVFLCAYSVNRDCAKGKPNFPWNLGFRKVSLRMMCFQMFSG